MLTPANLRRGFRLCTLARAATAELRCDVICGKWERRTKPLFGASGGHTLVEEFVNWQPDHDAILRFTRKYGPLCDLPFEPGEYVLEIAEWRACQDFFRIAWSGVAKGVKRTLPNAQWSAEPGDRLVARLGEVLYITHTLRWFLHLEACCLPPERLRVCARPGCETPFFIARHLRQNYCTERCAQWGQRQWKQKWWAEHGDEWRKKRQRTQPKKHQQSGKAGKKHGPRKTR